MAEIKDYEKCEKCVHNKVCSLKEDKKEVIDLLTEKIEHGATVYPDAFKIEISCKEFQEQEQWSIRDSYIGTGGRSF